MVVHIIEILLNTKKKLKKTEMNEKLITINDNRLSYYPINFLSILLIRQMYYEIKKVSYISFSIVHL